MKKYWTIFRVELQNTMAFRGAATVWMLFDLLWLAIFPFLWIAVMRTTGESIRGWDEKMIATYFVFLALLTNLIFMHPETHVGDEIYDGKLTNYLPKPQNYLLQTFLHELAWKVVRTLLFVPIFLVIVFVFHAFIDFSAFSHSGFLALALLFALVLFFLVALCVGFVSFWFEESYPVRSLFWITSGLFGGLYLPLEFFPHWLAQTADFLPFKYAIYFPVKVLIGDLTRGQLVNGFIGQFAWLAILAVMVALLWRIGLKRYSAVGR